MQARAANRATPHHGASVRVWDRFVRLSHWTVVIGFFVAYFAEDVLTLHVWAGYVVGVVVVLRIVWGFIGPRHARFLDFLYRPSDVLAYLRDQLAFRAERHLGHSPTGGAMILALLLGLLATIGSGLVLFAIEENAGPLAGIVASAPSQPALATSDAERDEADEGREHQAGGAEPTGEVWEEAHEVLANLMLILIALHVAGVLLASRVHRENLIKAMITGDKRAPAA